MNSTECEYIDKKPFSYGVEGNFKILPIKGKRCTLDQLLCHFYDNPVLIELCPTRRKSL